MGWILNRKTNNQNQLILRLGKWIGLLFIGEKGEECDSERKRDMNLIRKATLYFLSLGEREKKNGKEEYESVW